MLRVDAYATTEGLVVTVIGHCSGKRHAGKRCETAASSQLVPTFQIERYGLGTALVLVLDRIIVGSPQLEELALC